MKSLQNKGKINFPQKSLGFLIAFGLLLINQPILKAQNIFPNLGLVELLNPTNSPSESQLTGIYLKTRGSGGEGSKTWGIYTAAIGGGFGVVPNAFEIWEYPETAPRLQLLPGGTITMGNNGGNVGIGISNPIYKFDVVGDGRFSGNLFGGEWLQAKSTTGTLSFRATNDQNAAYNIIYSTLADGATSRDLQIWGGTGTVNALFDNFTVRARNSTFSGNVNALGNLYGGEWLQAKSTAGELSFRATANDQNALYNILYTTSNNQATSRDFHIYGSTAVTNSMFDVFGVHANYSKFYGKVIIGQVNIAGTYGLYVQDGILTEKVKIALKNTPQWADFVFAPEYRLMSLAEVEAYIKSHKHLPGIESAEEMVEKGLDVAEMQAKHMQKIEELTLYAIEQDKKIKSLEERLAALEQLLLKNADNK